MCILCVFYLFLFRNWNIYSLLWLTHSDLQKEPEHRYQSISSEMFVNSWSSPVGNQFDWDSSNTWQCWNSGCGWEVALRLLLWSLGLLVANICESFKFLPNLVTFVPPNHPFARTAAEVTYMLLLLLELQLAMWQLVVLCVAAGVRIRRRKLDLWGERSSLDMRVWERERGEKRAILTLSSFYLRPPCLSPSGAQDWLLEFVTKSCPFLAKGTFETILKCNCLRFHHVILMDWTSWSFFQKDAGGQVNAKLNC